MSARTRTTKKLHRAVKRALEHAAVVGNDADEVVKHLKKAETEARQLRHGDN